MLWCSNRFNVVSEPFLDLYKKSLRSEDERLAAQAEIRNTCGALLRADDAQPIFVKEMAYHAEPFVTDDFLGAINNVFLIRDPSLSIPSLYRMRADYAEPETGFEGQIRLLRRVMDLTGEAPLVIDSERLRTSAEPIVRRFFGRIGEDMPPGILSWPVGSREEWIDRESWHQRAINSEGFEQPSRKVNLSELPKKVIRSIDNNRPYYEQLKDYVDEDT